MTKKRIRPEIDIEKLKIELQKIKVHDRKEIRERLKELIKNWKEAEKKKGFFDFPMLNEPSILGMYSPEFYEYNSIIMSEPFILEEIVGYKNARITKIENRSDYLYRMYCSPINPKLPSVGCIDLKSGEFTDVFNVLNMEHVYVWGGDVINPKNDNYIFPKRTNFYIRIYWDANPTRNK